MNDRENDPIDFSPLDPASDRARLDRTVASILQRAAPELAARRAANSPVGQLARFTRPVLAAAAVVALIAAGVLTQVGTGGSDPVADQFDEALGVPVQMADWLSSGQAPSTAELFVELEDSP